MNLQMQSILVALLLLAAVGPVLGSKFDPTSYPSSQQLLPTYEVYWRVDEVEATLYLALHVQTTGWVGFGISEITSGSMPGADIVVGAVVDGVGSITDRWSSEYALPNLDDCQDWFLVAAEEVDGYTTIEVKRALDTKDAQDRAIVAGPNKVIVAYGDDGVDDLSYHQGNRITSEIIFYGKSVDPPLPSEVQFIDLQLPNYTIPRGVTNYVCMSFQLPSDKDYSVVQIDPLVDERNLAHVHHFLAFICTDIKGGSVEAFRKPGDCFTPSGNGGCIDIMVAWAAGGGPTILPSEAGFPMGASDTFAKYLLLEIHYNDVDGVGGYEDNSGVRLWYTPNLRKYEAAWLVTGDPGILLPPIPPHSITEYETECPSECTSTLPYELTVWQSFPHMHEVGSEIWTTQWRDGEMISEFGRVEYWAFDHQQSQVVNFTIKPGDRLNTHCVYNTSSRDTFTYMNVSSSDEMCMHFIGYYPRVITKSGQLFPYCGYVSENMTICGEFEEENLLNYPNPSIRDPPGGANRTFGVSGPCQESTVAPTTTPITIPTPAPTSTPTNSATESPGSDESKESNESNESTEAPQSTPYPTSPTPNPTSPSSGVGPTPAPTAAPAKNAHSSGAGKISIYIGTLAVLYLFFMFLL